MWWRVLTRLTAVYTNIKSLHYTPKANTMFYVSYFSIKKKKILLCSLFASGFKIIKSYQISLPVFSKSFSDPVVPFSPEVSTDLTVQVYIFIPWIIDSILLHRWFHLSGTSLCIFLFNLPVSVITSFPWLWDWSILILALSYFVFF